VEPTSGQVVTALGPTGTGDPHTLAIGLTGQTLWSAPGVVATAIGPGLVAAALPDTSGLVGLDAATGKERWRAKGSTTIGSVTVAKDAVVSVFTPGGTD
jgi:outer membrane protein assembly factor BamB